MTSYGGAPPRGLVCPHLGGALGDGLFFIFCVLWCSTQKAIYGTEFSPSTMWVQGSNSGLAASGLTC